MSASVIVRDLDVSLCQQIVNILTRISILTAIDVVKEVEPSELVSTNLVPKKVTERDAKTSYIVHEGSNVVKVLPSKNRKLDEEQDDMEQRN